MSLLSNLAESVQNLPTLAWDLGTFLQNAANTLKQWGGYLIVLIGVVMIIVGIYQIAKGFISHGKTQTNWFVAIALLILGGALMVGGWSWVAGIASGGKQTIDDLGNGGTGGAGGAGGTIIPMLLSYFR